MCFRVALGTALNINPGVGMMAGLVLLVLLYHVIYFYNNKGVYGGVGGFGDGQSLRYHL